MRRIGARYGKRVRAAATVGVAMLLLSGGKAAAGLHEEIDQFLRQEESFGRGAEPPAPAAPAEPRLPAPAAEVVPEEPAAEPSAEAAPTEAEPPAAAGAVEPAPALSDTALRQALAEKTAALAAAQTEIERLKSVIRRIWETTRRERADGHYNMGCLYRSFKQYKLAEAEFLKALEIEPNDAGTHYNLAILYDDDLKDKTKARQHYERFLELAPEDKDAARVREWLVSLP